MSSMSRIALLLLTVAIWGQTWDLVDRLRTVQQLRTDRAQLESVEYGMLDAQAWVDSVIWILEKRVREFDLGPQNRAVLLDSFSRMLDTLMVEVDAYIRKKNAEGGGWQRFMGRLRQSLQDFLLDFDDLRTQAPQYAEAIMVELNKPQAREDLIVFMTSTLRDLTSSTFTKVDRTAIDDIFDKYGCTEMNYCRALLDARAAKLDDESGWRVLLVLVMAAAMLIIIASEKRLAPARQSPAIPLALMLAAMTALMVGGVLTPMMNVEARITELRLSLLGEDIAFADQVLYFQSKSIMDIVMVMIGAGDAKSTLVGVLVMTFSVLFPLAKVASGGWMLTPSGSSSTNPVIRFFALKSSKWSMADVLVVAIIMGYLGFAGLMDSQLRKITDVPSAEVLTTNGTELQWGFFLFFGFCIVSLLTSSLIERQIGSPSELPAKNSPSSTVI